MESESELEIPMLLFIFFRLKCLFQAEMPLLFPVFEYSNGLKVARNSFKHLHFDGSLQPVFITWCYNHGIKKLHNH